MGSGFSGCGSHSSVGVAETGRSGSQTIIKGGGGVHSDSCDSGISISDSSRKNRTRHAVSSQHVTDLDSEEDEEEEMVEGNDVACGTDFVMTSTPRPTSPRPFTIVPSTNKDKAAVDSTRKSRLNSHSAGRSLRHNVHSSPNLLDHAIHEEDEESHEGEPEDKRLRAQRPPRPKSAHFRKSRAQALRGRTARSRGQNTAQGSVSGGESSADMTSDEEGFDSDILSIPDETLPHSPRPNSLTTVRLGPQFQPVGKVRDTIPTPVATPATAINLDTHNISSNTDDIDWWTEDELGSARTRDDCRSRESSFTPRCNIRLCPEGRVAKKASERSISSILLTTAVELDTAPASVPATNPACFAVTNPEITQHILKCLQEIERELRASTLTIGVKEKVTKEDYSHIVTSLRPRFIRLLGDFKMASGEVLGRLPIDCQHIVQLEDHFTQRLMRLTSHSTGQVELSSMVTQHLRDLEELFDREAVVPARVSRPLVVATNGRQAQWDESGVEDESDSMEEDLQGTGTHEFAVPLPPLRRHDRQMSKDGERKSSSSAVAALPPRGSCKSARPASLSSSMNSSRARSSSRRPTTDTPLLCGSKTQAVLEDERSEASSTTASTNATTTTAIANSSSSRCSTSKGGRKSRPDSGIVVSSCSASYSSSEATRETDADLATQTEWIATSLEMLEQILQVRTESHDTIKSLVDAVTHGSTSEQLKAHALYRWLASQSMAYYAKCKTAKASSPTGKLRQLAGGKVCYASLYQEMAKAAGLKCEKIEGYAKGPDYRPGTPIGTNNSLCKHSWNAVLLGGHYHFLDAGFGALPCKFFIEHFFMTPPDEMRLSHFPRDKRWLLMTQSLSMNDFEGTLKTWPTMFAFNIRPLNMKSVLRSYDGRLSITVLLRNVAVSPQLEYIGPGTPQDTDALAFNIDQEIRNTDNAETFHLNLPEEGTYYFTLMVHDLEEDEDIPAFQYRVEYTDELL